MGEQWLRRRGEKEQKGIGDDRLEKTVSGRYRGREAKRGYWRASDINLKALQVAREETNIKGYPTFLYASDCRTSGTSQTERDKRQCGQCAWKGERKWINEGVKGSLESTRNEENMRNKDDETRRGSTHGGLFRLSNIPKLHSNLIAIVSPANQFGSSNDYKYEKLRPRISASSITRLVRAATPKKKDSWFGEKDSFASELFSRSTMRLILTLTCKPQRRAAAVYLIPGNRRYSRCGLPTPVASLWVGSSSGSVQYSLIYSGLGGVGDERARCNTEVSHQNSQTDNVEAERAVTGLLHILARTSKRALRLPEIQPRVSGKRG
ncbi:hypothetical protein G5I_08469 [Acromyrmex echinatior]|uniref:Uncharacterized protein n=1 Tax=Acromyrmex echinatior TaxID=103372 RepID=F4WRL6_ACREC|nr:hypothetical protein G5I_08469 [Acromyrmex echinatior]